MYEAFENSFAKAHKTTVEGGAITITVVYIQSINFLTGDNDSRTSHLIVTVDGLFQRFWINKINTEYVNVKPASHQHFPKLQRYASFMSGLLLADDLRNVDKKHLHVLL